MSYEPLQRDPRAPSRPNPEVAKREGYAPAAFWVVAVVTILLAIVVVALVVLYFRKNASLIDPSECPDKTTGVVAQPDVDVSTTAINCGSQLDCTYTVGSLSEAVGICTGLGPTKCVKFSLSQVSNTNDFTMKVSSSATTTASVGTDSYRILL